MYESPEPDSRPRLRLRRGAPQVVLAASGVVLATVFAAVASLAAGSDSANEAPATQPPRKEAVRDALSIVPTSSPSASVEQTSSVSETTTTSATTTTTKKTRVTTITRPDGTTTTVTTEEPPPANTSTTTTTTTTKPADPTTTSKPVDPTTTTNPTTTTTSS